MGCEMMPWPIPSASQGAKPAEEAAPAQEAEGEPAVADDGKFEGDYDGTPDQKQLAWIKDALGEDCPPLDKDVRRRRRRCILNPRNKPPEACKPLETL